MKLRNWLIMAPMAGITDLPFRLIVKEFGPGLVTTEMVSAVGLAMDQRHRPPGTGKTLRYLKSDPREGPLAVQIFGADPKMMARAADIAVQAGACLVDINMGCPARKVCKTGAGGALLRDIRKAGDVVSAVRKASSVPVTVKIRGGWSPDQPVACELARRAEDAGADAVTVHPRFVTQGFSGKADWCLISQVKDRISIPVIGNGDVFNATRAVEMRRKTGCDGVMLGRGAVGNPWIFRDILALERGLAYTAPTLGERRAVIMAHFQLLSRHVGEAVAARKMRGLLLWYTKGLPNSSRFRGTVSDIRDFETLVLCLDQYFASIEDIVH